MRTKTKRKKRDLYEELGVQRGADRPAIKRAYRKQMTKLHPDRNGKSDASEQFLAVQHAYRILVDDEARKRYDETGMEEEADNVERRAFELVMSLIAQLAEDCAGGDLFQMANAELLAKKTEFVTERAEVKKKAASFRSTAARIKRKKEGENVLAHGILQMAEAAERHVQVFNSNVEMIECAINTLKNDYSFTVDKEAGPAQRRPKMEMPQGLEFLFRGAQW